MRGTRILLAFLLATAMAACVTDKKSTSDDDPRNLDAQGDVDAGSDAPDVLQGDTDFNPDDPRCVLIPSVAGDVFVNAEGSVALGAYVYSTETGSAIENQLLGFEVVEDNSAGAHLSTSNAFSDSDGLGEFSLVAGLEAGRIVIEVSTSCSEPIEIEVDAVALPSGDLRVRFNYPFQSTYNVAPVDAQLFLMDSIDCNDLDPGEDPHGEFLSGSTGSVNGQVVFERLATGQDFTIVAIGYGAFGERAAWGCDDGIETSASITTDVEIDMILLPLDPVGVYDVVSHWDFREALRQAGGPGAIIAQIADIFEDPGRGLYDLIIDVLESQFGGLIAGLVDTVLDLFGLDDTIADAINNVIDSVPFLSDLVTIGQDITQVVTNLELLQEWEIGKLLNDFSVYGRETVTGVALYWRLGCGPLDPPDCGRLPIEWDPDGIGTLAGDWTGFVIGYNGLTIDPHPIDFNYGILILYVLENLLLPAITGMPAPVTLLQVAQQLIGCPGIGDFFSGGNNDCLISDSSIISSITGCICDAETTCNARPGCSDCVGIENVCNGFVNTIFGPLITGIIGGLDIPSVITASGECDLINNDDDLEVEVLANGELRGTLNFGGTPAPFTADFSGTRQ